jgi:pimeloyl-ACP methyl ester carboxylesterase
MTWSGGSRPTRTSPAISCRSSSWRAGCPEAALAWYRAVGALASVEVGPISVPTLYLWGDADHSVGASAARWTADFATGPFRFEIVPGVGHFITDEAPDLVTAHLLEHLAAHP